MPAFKYYIVTTYEGAVRGTNSEEVATNCSLSEDYFVVDVEAAKWLTHGELTEILDIETPETE